MPRGADSAIAIRLASCFHCKIAVSGSETGRKARAKPIRKSSNFKDLSKKYHLE
jgi:hypothetical protein